MAQIRVDVRYPIIDIIRAKKRIHDHMTAFTFDVLREWVTESTNVIPVWSGASRASFLKLANQVQVAIEIDSLIVAPIGSRVPLGYETSIGVIIADARGSSGLYGWDWESTLFYIDIVQDRVRFIEAGNRVVDRRKPPPLPPPPVKRGARNND